MEFKERLASLCEQYGIKKHGRPKAIQQLWASRIGQPPHYATIYEWLTASPNITLDRATEIAMAISGADEQEAKKLALWLLSGESVASPAQSHNTDNSSKLRESTIWAILDLFAEAQQNNPAPTCPKSDMVQRLLNVAMEYQQKTNSEAPDREFIKILVANIN